MDLASSTFERLRDDGETSLLRLRDQATSETCLLLCDSCEPAPPPAPCVNDEMSVRASLDTAWALVPEEQLVFEGRQAVRMRDPGGSCLASMIGRPPGARAFLDLAISLATALKQVHHAGLIHRDVRPANVFVDRLGRTLLTGFGRASRLARERNHPDNPEISFASLPYMAPEQSGRLNRSVDQRSDLYALGVTLYELLVGARPFVAKTPAEWIFCHVARVPPPPSVRIENIPPVLDAIILKLLSKNAEDRYQTAEGIEHDLRRCRADLERDGTIPAFPLGSCDASSRLNLPERLYGREAEVRQLVEAFESIAAHPRFEFVLVSGAPGIGKSSIVSELRSAVYARNGLFAAGKFDPFQGDVPYATLVEALRSVLKQLLTQDDAVVAQWRAGFRTALGASGQLMVDLLPELELLIGPQPELPAVSPPEAKNRFRLIFCRFVAVFASAGHPLVLFLDDLQWADNGTLELLELIATEGQVPHLLLVGAYRDTELLPDHRLAQFIQRVASSRGDLLELPLHPLRERDLYDMVRDAFAPDQDDGAALARLIHEKTRGNPFFTVQFLRTLHAEQLVLFDASTVRWTWDLDAIRVKGITDNVAALLAERLKRLRGLGRRALGFLACLGRGASADLLSALSGVDRTDLENALAGLVSGGLLHRIGDRYEFAHDRVREAAHASIAPRKLAAIHLAIARQLDRNTGENQPDERRFEIVDHYNRAGDGIVLPEERLRVARLNFATGQRSKDSAAYASALAYFGRGLALLGEDRWESHYRLAFDLGCNAADCHFMLGDFDETERDLKILADRVKSLSDLRAVVGRQLSFYVYVGRVEHAVDLSLACLARMGVELPPQPTLADLQAEYEDWLRCVGDRPIGTLAKLPRATDTHRLDVMSALADLFTPAGTVNTYLHYLAALRLAKLSLAFGNADETPHAYACLAGQVFGWHIGTFDQAAEIGQLARRLVEDEGYDRYAARVYAVLSGTIGPWSVPLADCYAMAVRATEIGREQGGIIYSGYAWGCALTALLDGGRHLAEVERQAESSLAIVARLRFPLVADFMTTQMMLAKALRGATNALLSFDDGSFDEQAFAARLASAPHLWHALVRYRIRKLQLALIGRDWEACAALTAWLEGQVGELKVFELAEYHFYAALGRSGGMCAATAGTHPERVRAIAHSHAQLATWTRLCPDNFACRAELLRAELCRLAGDELAAEHAYETAIGLARANGFQQVEAVANEFAAHFYAERGFATIAEAYARTARSVYEGWGAAAKARLLDAAAGPLGPPTKAGVELRPSVDQLDLSAAFNMYQALSQEIQLDRLVERLMATVVEHAGAVRGLLLLSREGRLRIVAEAVVRETGVEISTRKPAHFAGELPQSVLNYVTRTHEVIIIDDALEANAHSGDPYILRARPRSVLCLPLVKQARLVGILYLENDLASHIFTEGRVALLQLVASQAAILIENAELFLDVQRTREEARQATAELRRSFDTIPALAWSAAPDGSFEFSNKQWHDYTGVPEKAAQAGTWMQAFHPGDLEKISEKWRQLKAFKSSGEFEARMRRFDGQFRRFLVRLTPMCDAAGEIIRWHGTNTDIDDLKRAEEAQEALARSSRVTALGALTVSIAHEVNQPLMAIVTNAATCMRWLNASPPDVEEARLAASRIIRDGHRAGEVITSIRAMARNAAPDLGPLDVEDLFNEVLQLLQNELDRLAISVSTRFAPRARSIYADRIQIQQVILNLVMNAIEAIGEKAGAERVISIVSKAGGRGFTEISVADSGIGLSPDCREQIFEAFFTTKPEGVGIGLSICRTIVESLGGRLWAEANAPSGTIFSLALPNAPAGQLAR